MKKLPQQKCPACKRFVRPSERYPNYACRSCVEKAVDKKGRRVAFYNITMDGHGCQGILVDTNKFTRSRICFINGIEFTAEEAYMGGIVLVLGPTQVGRKDTGP